MAPANKTSTKTIESPGMALVKATIGLMDELVRVMMLEVDLVTERKLDEHKSLLKHKQRLTMDYRSNMKSISTQPDLMKQMPPEVVAAAKISAQKLSDMTDRNAKFLRGTVMATQRLLQSIVSIVKQEVLPQGNYHNPNVSQVGAAAYSPVCKPVAVSRTA